MKLSEALKRLFWLGAPTGQVDARTVDLISQVSHVGWGLALVLGPVAIFGPKALATSAFVTILGFAFKESIIDPRVESPIVRGSGWRDFVFACIGVLGGAILWEVGHRLLL